jgi:NADH-quinone oxidoreductase subunit E
MDKTGSSDHSTGEISEGSLLSVEPVIQGGGPVSPADKNAVRRLESIQDKYGYLPRSALESLSQALGIAIGPLHAVASSYPGFRLDPPTATVGVGVCCDLVCFGHGSAEFYGRVRIALERQIDTGTVDLKKVSCLGACDQVREGMPAFTLNGVAHSGVSSDDCPRIITCELIERLVEEICHEGSR